MGWARPFKKRGFFRSARYAVWSFLATSTMLERSVTGAEPSTPSLTIPKLLANANRSLSVDPTWFSLVEAQFKSWLTASITVASFFTSDSATGWPVTSESSPRVTLGALETGEGFFSATDTSADWGASLVGWTGAFSATAVSLSKLGWFVSSFLGDSSPLAGTASEIGVASAVLGCPTWVVKAGSTPFVATSSAWTWRAKTTGLSNKLAKTIETRLDFFIYKLLWKVSF